MTDGYSGAAFNSDGWSLTEGTLTFAPEIRYLRNQQFAGREDINRVVLHSGIGFMEEEVFAECPCLSSVTLSPGLINIGIAAFTSCTALGEIDLPSTVATVEEGAFLDCEKLRKVAFHEGLREIADLAFQNCGLYEAIIPKSVERIGEEAFFSCPDLTRVEVPNADAVIGLDAFSFNYRLIQGYIAPGFPTEAGPDSELLYSLLWASCPERHSGTVEIRASDFIRKNEALIMERVFKYNNVPAMTGLLEKKLLRPENIDAYVRQALSQDQKELTALLIAAKGACPHAEDEFEL